MSAQEPTSVPVIAKLLRAIANGSDARALKHDVIFNAAADALDLQAELLAALHTTVNWFTPPNDSGPFPLKQVAAAIAKVERAALTTGQRETILHRDVTQGK